MTVAFALLGGWPMVKGGAPRLWAAGIAVAFLLTGLVAPAILTPLNKAWMGLAHLLSRIVNPVIMALLFYGVFTPIAALGRMIGRDPLRFKYDKSAGSYWIPRQTGEITPASMKNQF
jgi:hypothetical protein